MVVESETETDIKCLVTVGGLLHERKGINLPNTPLPIPSMTKKDHADLAWAMTKKVDYIALSFVRQAEDCREAKRKIKELDRRRQGRALLVAKIEKAEAIENLDEIIAATDGVMVARGDLGVETSVEHVPVYQKRIIEKAVANDKFVITATQMLQSMIESPHPTRAEASDVANAVWDGTDAVMLSAETASGSYPLEAVDTMARIIDAAETVKPGELRKPVKFSQPPSGRTSQAMCKAAAYAAKEVMTEKVAVFTESGSDGSAAVEHQIRTSDIWAHDLQRRVQSTRVDLGCPALPSCSGAEKSRESGRRPDTRQYHDGRSDSHRWRTGCDRRIAEGWRANASRRRCRHRRRDNNHDGRAALRSRAFKFGDRLDDR